MSFCVRVCLCVYYGVSLHVCHCVYVCHCVCVIVCFSVCHCMCVIACESLGVSLRMCVRVRVRECVS